MFVIEKIFFQRISCFFFIEFCILKSFYIALENEILLKFILQGKYANTSKTNDINVNYNKTKNVKKRKRIKNDLNKLKILIVLYEILVVHMHITIIHIS